MLNYKDLSLAHELVSQLESHYLVHIMTGKNPELKNEFALVNWNPSVPDMIFKELDALIEKLTELLEQQKKEK